MALSTDEKLGDCSIRIMPGGVGFKGVVIRRGKMSAVQEDTDRDRLRARLRNEAGTLHPNYFGMEGAITRFREFFPEAFEDTLYMADERSYKDRSRERLLAVLTSDEALSATPEQAAEVRGAYVTNLLSPFELARASAVLRSETGAAFVRGAATFTQDDYARGLAAMTAAVAPHGRISWPIATYLPFLWNPARHMFLKPTATRDFAERIGHPFAYEYEPALKPAVYQSLLDLTRHTDNCLVSLCPADRIDVQSFIWVVGDYGDKEKADLAGRRA